MPLISVLIILGAVSTAVNMVVAMVKRICSGLDKMKKEIGTDEKRKNRYKGNCGKDLSAVL